MLSLQHINGRNVWDILKLKVSEDQQSFVGFPMSLKIQLLGISIVRLDLLRRARRTAKK